MQKIKLTCLVYELRSSLDFGAGQSRKLPNKSLQNTGAGKSSGLNKNNNDLRTNNCSKTWERVGGKFVLDRRQTSTLALLGTTKLTLLLSEVLSGTCIFYACYIGVVSSFSILNS